MKQTVVVVTGKTDNGDHIDTTVFSHMPTRREFFENACQYEDIGEDEAEDSDYESDDFAWVYPDPDRVNDPDEPIGEGDVQVGNIFFEVEVCEIVEAKRENRAKGAKQKGEKKMTKADSDVVVTFLSNGDDWKGMYVDDDLFTENHDSFLELLPLTTLRRIKEIRSVEVSGEYLGEIVSRCPEKLSDVPPEHIKHSEVVDSIATTADKGCPFDENLGR